MVVATNTLQLPKQSSQWRKIQQMQPMWVWISQGGHSEKAYDEESHIVSFGTLGKRTKAQSEHKEHATIVTKPENCGTTSLLSYAVPALTNSGAVPTILVVLLCTLFEEVQFGEHQVQSNNVHVWRYSLHCKEKSRQIKRSCSKCEVWVRDCDHVCIWNIHCTVDNTLYRICGVQCL